MEKVHDLSFTIIYEIINIHKSITIQWVAGHIIIKGNENVTNWHEKNKYSYWTNWISS